MSERLVQMIARSLCWADRAEETRHGYLRQARMAVSDMESNGVLDDEPNAEGTETWIELLDTASAELTEARVQLEQAQDQLRASIKELQWERTAERPADTPGEHAEERVNIPETIPESTTATLFACPSCDRSFATQGSLNGHSRVHVGRVPCPTCGEMFVKGTGLASHERTAHPPHILGAAEAAVVLETFEARRLRLAHEAAERTWTQTHDGATA